MRNVRIGAGAGFSGDRIEPAVDLAARGDLDFLVFECLAERTIALAQLARLSDPAAGYDPLLERRMRAVLPVTAKTGTKILTNMGAANPVAAARRTADIAAGLGLTGLKIAAVTGDDVLSHIDDCVLDETGAPAHRLGERLVSANAYIGVAGLVEALALGADVVICGRASDPALFLAPLVHTFGWAMDDFERLGRGTLVGHLLECGAQVTGGYFADPGIKDVPDLAHIGFPLAEVAETGNATITKLPGTGGLVSRATATEQLLYEIHDPARYLQPDVVADFSGVRLDEVGPDRVAVSGGQGHAPTGAFKVSVGYRDGWLGEGQISYAGANAVARGRLAIDVVAARLKDLAGEITEERGALIGLDSVRPTFSRNAPGEVRMRYAARCASQDAAARVAEEVESLYLCGPMGGGGVSRTVREIVAIASTLISREHVRPAVQLFEVADAPA
ncbi:acyclic terpene utilization AtuA family protein [Acuticoccus sp. MNP-M23]|uniref:acyclic terpene utilization AtuA family protein n=1 Tax=Acuticoccus sp. MNP-M23 TaxID=3072793 RepID=UPI00281606CE|nr:acyclic terpene utilization AtuA family protein [Acuticoccus sp. MNP-M23]WMS40905.1 acyclic terpene utilization AtuA family protein [Acuticoccus sp. MNP-M23]